jgi:hypothetical protein
VTSESGKQRGLDPAGVGSVEILKSRRSRTLDPIGSASAGSGATAGGASWAWAELVVRVRARARTSDRTCFIATSRAQGRAAKGPLPHPLEHFRQPSHLDGPRPTAGLRDEVLGS